MLGRIWNILLGISRDSRGVEQVEQCQVNHCQQAIILYANKGRDYSESQTSQQPQFYTSTKPPNSVGYNNTYYQTTFTRQDFENTNLNTHDYNNYDRLVAGQAYNVENQRLRMSLASLQRTLFQSQSDFRRSVQQLERRTTEWETERQQLQHQLKWLSFDLEHERQILIN